MKSPEKFDITIGQEIQPSQIQKYDIIYYNAAQSNKSKPKPRPFLVLENTSSHVTVCPLTHTNRDDSIYNRYNVECSEAVNNYLTSISHDKDKTNTGQTNLKVGQIRDISKRRFYQSHHNPHRLGNLADNLPPQEIQKLEQDIVGQQSRASDEYLAGQRIHQKYTNAEINKDPKLLNYVRTKTISLHQYREINLCRQNGIKPLHKFDYIPAMNEQRYLYLRRKQNHKRYQRQPKHRKRYWQQRGNEGPEM